MYNEWTSLANSLQNGDEDSRSVLSKLPPAAGKEVVVAVVRQLGTNLGISQPPEPSPLTTDREVVWYLEVICYGLGLPLTEHDTIRDCVNVYCEWLSSLLPIPKVCVPRPICDDPNFYSRKIIGHLYNLFLPRKGEVWPFLYQDLAVDTINRQAVLCHRVLRTLQNVAQCSSRMTPETWEALLLFLLSINDTLLAPPTIRDDVGDHLCERVLSVLFEVWLLACARSFPTPPLWKTFREMCTHWRHRSALVEQWSRVTIALTARLLQFTYGPDFPELRIPDEDSDLIPAGMTQDCIAQTWFRFLHCSGNPVDLCRPALISQTQKFLQFALMSETVIDPCQHPCLDALPGIFLKAMKGVATLVDAFLGTSQRRPAERLHLMRSASPPPSLHQQPSISNIPLSPPFTNSSTSSSVGNNMTPTPHRRLAKSFSVAPSSVTKGIPKSALIGFATRTQSVSHQPGSAPSSGPPSTSSLGSSMQSLGTSIAEIRLPSTLSPLRPKCNSILHLFGVWLFEAVHVGTELSSDSEKTVPPAKEAPNVPARKQSSQFLEKHRRSAALGNATSAATYSHSSVSNPLQLSDSVEIPSSLTIDKYDAGRAEAVGALCRIFCAKKTGEEILPAYLSRFYLAVQAGLSASMNSGSDKICGELMASILVNSADLLRVELDGVQIVLPHLIEALEIVLPDKDIKLKSTTVLKTDLRRACIHLLLSMLALPLHFQNLPIKSFGKMNRPSSDGGPPIQRTLTFAQMKPRLVNLLINALQIETDSYNAQMLLGGLMLCVQDSAAFEQIDQVTQVDADAANESTANLLSSDSAHALFVRATYLVCHRLISSWKTDLNVSLAALELLSGLARMHIREQDSLECKRAVKWLCDYIVYQCSRPPPAHSKDLHSTIVAAFGCAATWLVEHPYLLDDKDSLATVLEVVELGISGSKSQGKPGEALKKKHEKELKPASMRVRDAAESLLTVILEQVGYFPSPSGASELSSKLDEVSLLRHCNSATVAKRRQKYVVRNKQDDDTDDDEDDYDDDESEAGLLSGRDEDKALATSRFHYFVVENSTMLALLEEPLGNDQDPQPTVTVLIRGPFGRNAWTMQLRHLPRHKSGGKFLSSNPGRPLPMDDVGIKHNVSHRFFPESVESVPLCKADKSIPPLESVVDDDIMTVLLEQQIAKEEALMMPSENQSSTPAALSSYPNVETECHPPPICHEFQTARLFLSNFGLLSLEALKETLNSPVPSLVALDAGKSGFHRDLDLVDSISTRTSDTVYIFYIKSGQRTSREILQNVTNQDNVNPQFLEFLLSLGWPVDARNWSGKPPNRPDNDFLQSSMSLTDHGGSIYNGVHQVLYWADVSSEVVFVVPTPVHTVTAPASVTDSFNETSDIPEEPDGCVQSVVDDLSEPGTFDRRSHDRQSFRSTNSSKRTLSLDLEAASNASTITAGTRESPQSESGRNRWPVPASVAAGNDTNVLVVWLESYEDHVHWSAHDLLVAAGLADPVTHPVLLRHHMHDSHHRDPHSFVIFIHAMRNGLFRVHLEGRTGKMNIATPLVDGMVVSRRVLGTLVRQTALNMCRRRRLENENYQPPHVRRKMKIQDIVQKYRSKMTEHEFYTHLFDRPDCIA